MAIFDKGKLTYMYSTSPVKINGPVSKLRMTTNKKEQILGHQLLTKGNKDKMRIKSNMSEDYLLSMKGWS